MTIYEQQEESLSQAITSAMPSGMDFGDRHQHINHLRPSMSQGSQHGRFEDNYMNGNMNVNFPFNYQNQGAMNRQYSYGSSMGDQFNLLNQISQYPHHPTQPFPSYQAGSEYLSSPNSNFFMAGQLSEVSTPSNSSSTDLSNVYYDALFPDHHRASWDANAMNMAVKRHRPYSPRKQSSASEDADSSRPKVYVLKACVSCKASHVACDIARPCQRCVRLNKGDTCVDAERKKRGRPCNSGKRQKEAAEKKRRERERELERLDECNHTGVPSVLMGRRDEVYNNQTPSNSYPNLQEQQDQDDILQMLSYVGM
ncbi:hypothetical protein K450DRAFT_216989 [Umbelopsis ramanniana AG]|uniref:Zn(2)-C6 fungal-type domain-containing protein n=1 Tax=Umbelopsis ramanniana AG TaxID=1314678 RepID=A0AAD5EIQ7_UMBRA|nr:uncharacterized protein K450DRAFT_216989 [Umbelopsis ramanniana AG]KAI8584578.1 hypothetical protein K450DRAFT_216989 [Umbelopsis ramanniana AG]